MNYSSSTNFFVDGVKTPYACLSVQSLYDQNISKGWGKNTQCGKTSNDKLEEVEMKIVSDKECREAEGFYKTWNEGNYTGVRVGLGTDPHLWTKV